MVIGLLLLGLLIWGLLVGIIAPMSRSYYKRKWEAEAPKRQAELEDFRAEVKQRSEERQKRLEEQKEKYSKMTDEELAEEFECEITGAILHLSIIEGNATTIEVRQKVLQGRQSIPPEVLTRAFAILRRAGVIEIKQKRGKTYYTIGEGSLSDYFQDKKEAEEKGNPDMSLPVLCIETVDKMDGHQFEYYCANLLRKTGFTNVEVTKGSGDQGVDVIAEKDSIRYAIQCKCYSSMLGNTPVQEVNAGKQFYKCHVGAVLTNQYFTGGAKELAEATGVLLWDRDDLRAMIKRVENVS